MLFYFFEAAFFHKVMFPNRNVKTLDLETVLQEFLKRGQGIFNIIP